MHEFTLAGFAEYLIEQKYDIEHANEVALEVGAAMIRDAAKAAIGTYTFPWQVLAASTQADRERQGFPANEPLLRTGEMRDSIGVRIIKAGHEAEIGSDNQIAVYQELGTSTIPARSFLAAAAAAKGKDVARVFRDVVGAAIAGRTIETELLHIVEEAAESIKRTVEKATFYDHEEQDTER